MAGGAFVARLRRAATLPNAIHGLLFVHSLSLAFGCFDGTLFGWHPFSMSLGYLFFMAEGLVAAWSIRTTASEERVRGLEMHALMQLRALMFIGIGAGAIIHNKNLKGRPHFKTTHGKLGLLTIILTGLSPVLGAITFRKLGLIHWFPEGWHVRMKKTHRMLGAVTWGMSLLTIMVALPHPAVHKALATPLWQLGTVTAGVLIALLLYGRPQKTGVLKGT